MSLYGHTNINIDSLKRWANALSIDNITEVDYGGEPVFFDEITKKTPEKSLLAKKKENAGRKRG